MENECSLKAVSLREPRHLTEVEEQEKFHHHEVDTPILKWRRESGIYGTDGMER
jgi:hypothetical protein